MALERADQKFLEDLLSFDDDQELAEIKGTLQANKWFLPRVCQLGFLSILERICDFHLIDIDTEYLGRTGLQYACQEGHMDIVTWLLQYGAYPKKSLWKEDSELYLATLNGNEDVINLLLSRRPDLAPDMSVCHCLMYAACLGGHLKLVKKWYAPGINVRETIPFTSDLNNCEQKYPLFAACQGEHFEVAEFLIKECGGAITEDICLYFPEFTTRLVRSLFLISDTKHLLDFYMANYKIECMLPCWFYALRNNEAQRRNSEEDEDDPGELEENMFEITIDVKENKLSVLPDEVLWAMKELTLLDASYNPLRSIPNAVDPSLITLNQIKTLNLSHCELESLSHDIFALPCLEQLNLSYNKLNNLDQQAEYATLRSSHWKCTRLQSLDVSHNLLTSLPTGIQSCAKMTTLIGSYNQLTTVCTLWQCPMKILDLSHNKMTTFAPNADQYWKQTLSRLNLQSNQIIELEESIVKMRLLTYLDMSSNKIQRMPPPNLWCCPLIFLNLSDNHLGIGRLSKPLQRVISLNSNPAPQLEFPKKCLASTLMELFLANNGLKTVPEGIGDLERLSVLDLSENTQITELPYELGKLKKLLNLKLVGITIKDKELQSLITSLDNDKEDVYASDVITYLEKKRRNCVHPGILKIVLLGCKNQNGPCIVQKLVKSKDVNTHDHKNLTITRMTSKQKKTLTYEIWEFPDSKVTSAILPCFLSLNSLYIIIHDVCYGGSDLLSVSEKMSSIQACVLRPKFIVVCTYSTSMEKSARENLEKEIRMKAYSGFPRAKFISLILGPKENVNSLHQEIYSAWETMSDATYEKDVKLQHRQVPKVFVEVMNNVKKLQYNICRVDEFIQAAGISRADLEDGIDENLKLHEFLLQVGAMLHYNIHMDELSDCVILNPIWLFEVFSKFLKSLTSVNNIKTAQLPISDVRAIFQKELPVGAYDYFPALLKLLETYNIGMRMTGSANKTDEFLLIPSLLPKQPPQFQFDTHKDACKAVRLYTLPAISPALWSHVISQLILAFERFSSAKWRLGEQKSNASATFDRTKSFRMGCTTSLKGLNIHNKNIQYWRTGIMMHHDQGHVVVEQVACTYSEPKKTEPGILVTVQTTGSLKDSSDLEQLSENTKKLSVMGIVRDELDEILELFNPKFRDPFDASMRQIYALCPLCHNIRPGSGCVSLDKIHFKVRDCAQMLLSKNMKNCLKGPTLLAHLVPEFLFLELPPELHLSAEDILLSDVRLGHGGAGTVRKGTYKGTDVAMKIFHDSPVRPDSDSENCTLYPNVAGLNTAILSKQEMDEMETEQIKISNAFSEVRREVGILSKLKHEFIVTFIGICIRPQLLLVMELAPLGTLRKELETRNKNAAPEQEHQDAVISQTLFSKDLIYKIIFQIGSGLFYLHKNSIIYRDLKPDNILVFSLSVNDRVNIKLSDYGISKFVTLHGVTGLLGTVGYMAPEVVSRQPYTEQVDIYSYAIVMLEVLTGLPPIEQLHKQSRSQVAKNQIAPSHLQGRKIRCNFPYLENLMEECWSHNMDERPSAEDVVKRMKADQFLLLHDSVWLDKSFPEKLEVTCIYACQTVGRWTVWICESGYSNHRYFSVYDVTSCSFTIIRQECHGPQVLDMTKVGPRIWVVCKDLDNLQVIVRGTQNKFEVYHGVRLEARATKILNHVFGNTEESESFILVGLEDGCVTAYHFNNYQRKSMTVITNIEFNRDTPVAQICSVHSSMIAVACGMSVYLLHVELPNNQETDMANKKGVLIPDLINHGSVSLKSVCDIYEPIVSMTAEGNAVWCSLENSCCLIKVDVESKKIVLVLSLSWEQSRDTVIVEQMINGSNSRQAASDSGPTSSRFSSEDTQKDNHDNNGSNVDDVFKEGSDKNTGAAANEDAGCKHTDSDSGQSDDYKPPLPPRRNPDFMRKASSLPNFNADKPPPIPKRLLCREIHVTSLTMSADTLIVGTNCGGIVLLPLIYQDDSHTSSSLPTLPFHLPMLRHLAKRNVCGRRTRSFTVPNSEHAGSFTESISALILADDKLVSLNKVMQPVLRDRSRPRHNGGSRREGSVFNAETMGMFGSPFTSPDVNPPNDTDHTDSHRPVSELPKPSDITQSAEIAVWDNITQQRLKTIRSYSHDLFNCFGWCCHAPDSASKSASEDEMF